MVRWICSLRSSSLFFSLRAALLSFLCLLSSSSCLFFLISSFFLSCLLLSSFTIDYLWMMEIAHIDSFKTSSIWSWWSWYCCMSNWIWLYIWGTKVAPVERSTGLRRAPRSIRVFIVSLLNMLKKFLANTLAIIFFSVACIIPLVSLICEFLLSTSSDFLALFSSSL